MISDDHSFTSYPRTTTLAPFLFYVIKHINRILNKLSPILYNGKSCSTTPSISTNLSGHTWRILALKLSTTLPVREIMKHPI